MRLLTIPSGIPGGIRHRTSEVGSQSGESRNSSSSSNKSLACDFFLSGQSQIQSHRYLGRRLGLGLGEIR